MSRKCGTEHDRLRRAEHKYLKSRIAALMNKGLSMKIEGPIYENNASDDKAGKSAIVEKTHENMGGG